VNKTVTCAIAAALGTALVGPAWADDETLEEITVTAQKREQNVQDVPIAISAFTAETLQAKDIGEIGALTRLAPNVNLDTGSPFSGDTSVLSASIRGIGQDDFAFNLDPGVGVYVDGVYLARTIGANQSLLDIDRIEILKGPQGTLFGRNTIGGAISIVTHTPGPEKRFVAQLTTGSFNRRDISVSGDFPVSDNFLTTLSFSSQTRDGYQKVIPYPTDSELGQVPWVVDPQTAFPKAGYETSRRNGGQNLQVVRGKALWKVSDQFNVTIAGDYAHQDQPSFPETVLAVRTPAGDNLPTATDALPGPWGFMGANYNFCISQPAALLNDVPAFLAAFPGAPPFWGTGVGGLCGPRAQGLGLAPGGTPLGGAGYVGGPVAYTPGGVAGNPSGPDPRIYWNLANTQTGDIDKTYATGPSFAKYNSAGSSVTVDVKLPEDLTFKSITGWRYIDWRIGVDLDGTPESIQEVTDHQEQDQFSQEFQLLGTLFDQRLNYVLGLYYFTEEGFVHDFVPFQGLLYVYDYQNDVDTESYAAFLHMDFQVTDRFGVTLGGRYTKEDKNFIGGQADLNGFTYKISGCVDPEGPANQYLDPSIPDGVTCQQALGFPVPGQPFRYFPADEQNQSWDVFTPTLGLQYDFTDDVMAYAKYSKGFKSGGWTTRLSQPITDGKQAEFEPEFAETYEIGLKSQLFNNRLLMNFAVFTTDYKDIQLNFQEGASPVLHNAGDATISGAELEAQAVIAGGFGFTFAGGYVDAEYDNVNPETHITTDNEIPKTPEYKINVGPYFDFDLGDGSVRLAVDYTHTAEMFNDSLNTDNLVRPAVDNWNASIRYVWQDGKYEFAVGGTNLSDERYLVTGSINDAAGEHVGTYSRPREWYATVRVNL